MRRSNAITIAADLDRVYRLGAEIESWPALLPHYRNVEILWSADDGRSVVARMAASRGAIPVSWTCLQQRDPLTPRITFRHIGGFTRGMQVSWDFEPQGSELVTVRIVHEFRKGWPVLDRFVSERVVGAFFVSAIASRTLSMVKLLAEADQLAHRGPLAPTLALDDQPAASPNPGDGA